MPWNQGEAGPLGFYEVMMGHVVESYIKKEILEWSWRSFSRIHVTKQIVIPRVPKFGHLVYMALSRKVPKTNIIISNRILYNGDEGGNLIPGNTIFTYRRHRLDLNKIPPILIGERVTILSGQFDVPEDLGKRLGHLLVSINLELIIVRVNISQI